MCLTKRKDGKIKVEYYITMLILPSGQVCLQRKRQLIFTVKHFIDNDRVDRWKNESINIFRRLRQKNR